MKTIVMAMLVTFAAPVTTYATSLARLHKSVSKTEFIRDINAVVRAISRKLGVEDYNISMEQEFRYDYYGNKIKRIEGINAVVRAILRKLDVNDIYIDVELERLEKGIDDVVPGIEDINAVVRAISRSRKLDELTRDATSTADKVPDYSIRTSDDAFSSRYGEYPPTLSSGEYPPTHASNDDDALAWTLLDDPDPDPDPGIFLML